MPFSNPLPRSDSRKHKQSPYPPCGSVLQIHDTNKLCATISHPCPNMLHVDRTHRTMSLMIQKGARGLEVEPVADLLCKTSRALLFSQPFALASIFRHPRTHARFRDPRHHLKPAVFSSPWVFCLMAGKPPFAKSEDRVLARRSPSSSSSVSAPGACTPEGD